MKESKDNTPLLELATFVMTCARTSIEEGQRQSVLRFLEVFKRISELPEEVEELTGEPILADISSEIDRMRYGEFLLTDAQRIEFTDRMVRRLTAELKIRSGL
jgi:hypothetical protein